LMSKFFCSELMMPVTVTLSTCWFAAVCWALAGTAVMAIRQAPQRSAARVPWLPITELDISTPHFVMRARRLRCCQFAVLGRPLPGLFKKAADRLTPDFGP